MVSLFQTINPLTLRLYSGDISLLQVKMWANNWKIQDCVCCLTQQFNLGNNFRGIYYPPQNRHISEDFYSIDELIHDKYLRLMIGWLTVDKSGKITNEMESVSM